jgi:glutathione S-transferase
MSTIKVWGIGTPRTLRVHWALRELGLDYDSEPVMPRSEGTRSSEYTRLNASRKVPTLVDGALVLSESGAIVNHLLRTYGAPKGLQPPAGGSQLARYEEWCFFALMELDATSTYVIRRHLDLPEVYGEAPAAVAAAREYCAQALVTAAQRLGDASFAMGEEFSGADILLTTCLNSAVRRQIEMPPSLTRYRERTTARDAYRAAFARNHPT